MPKSRSNAFNTTMPWRSRTFVRRTSIRRCRFSSRFAKMRRTAITLSVPATSLPTWRFRDTTPAGVVSRKRHVGNEVAGTDSVIAVRRIFANLDENRQRLIEVLRTNVRLRQGIVVLNAFDRLFGICRLFLFQQFSQKC